MTDRGTRLYSAPSQGSTAEGATGKAGGRGLPPPLPAWMRSPDRNCHEQPTFWWYAPEEDEYGERISTPAHATQAIRLCHACPFDLDCAAYGLQVEFHGIWGGYRLDGKTRQQKDDLLAGVERERQRRRKRRRAS